MTSYWYSASEELAFVTMKRILPWILAASAATLAIVLAPAGGAGSATRPCVAWASLPRRVVLSGANEVTVRVTLHATAACAGVTFDNGGTARLNGPGRNSDFPLRWSHIGATDTASFYWGIDAPGVYRIARGNLQTYDADSEHIPFTWHATSMVVRNGRSSQV